MSGFIILVIWMTLGVGIAAAVDRPDRARWTWAPVAAFFGPLWLSIAADQRAVARAARSLR